MKLNSIIFNPDTFGITGKSLRMLRNALIDNLRGEILVVRVATSNLCCGFLILNKTTSTATWSGDGFRTDGGGEGGRGYKKAEQLIVNFGIPYFEEYDELPNTIGKIFADTYDSETLLIASQRVADCFPLYEWEYKCYYDKIPNY